MLGGLIPATDSVLALFNTFVNAILQLVQIFYRAFHLVHGELSTKQYYSTELQ